MGHRWVDVARGWTLHSDRAKAVGALKQARRVTPQQTKYHPSVHETVHILAETDRRATKPDGRRELAAGLAGLPGSDADAVCAQVSFPPLDPATAHVARAVRILPVLVSLAEHRDSTADLGVLTPSSR